MKRNSKFNNIGMRVFKRIGMTVLIPIMITVLLAGAVFAIFNGVIEIIKTVLDEILDFVENPAQWLSEFMRHLHNTIVTAFRRRIGLI